jgi:SpoVK/Ycf46/Vps4 family AAA+-type ATPase
MGPVRFVRVGDGAEYTLRENHFESKYSPVEQEYYPKLLEYTLASPIKYEQIKEKVSEIGTFVSKEDCLSLKDIVLNKSTKEELKLAIHKVQKRDFLNTEWGLEEVPGFKMGSHLNLYGAPGTGKTISAKAIAKELGKDLLIVDYSSIISKWVGDTGKNIKKIFDEAKFYDAIIFMDEADSLLSKRRSLSEDNNSNSVNQNRNILMNEMDKHEGIMLFATNFFANYDEAINRRIAQHVKYDLPCTSSLEKIYKMHIPSKVPKGKISFKEIAEKSKGLSGGDVRNICINSIYDASMGKEKKLTQKHIASQVEKMIESKRWDKNFKTGNKRKIGLSS